jgi:Tol biopolymer transport system component
VGGASWPRRSAEYIVFTKDRGGDEFGQIFRLDVATGAITLISDGGRSQNSLGPWSHAGDRMAFGSTRRNGPTGRLRDGPEGPATTRASSR